MIRKAEDDDEPIGPTAAEQEAKARAVAWLRRLLRDGERAGDGYHEPRPSRPLRRRDSYNAQ